MLCWPTGPVAFRSVSNACTSFFLLAYCIACRRVMVWLTSIVIHRVILPVRTSIKTWLTNIIRHVAPPCEPTLITTSRDLESQGCHSTKLTFTWQQCCNEACRVVWWFYHLLKGWIYCLCMASWYDCGFMTWWRHIFLDGSRCKSLCLIDQKHVHKGRSGPICKFVYGFVCLQLIVTGLSW